SSARRRRSDRRRRASSEGLDQDGLTDRHVAARLVEHDETVARRHRGEDTRALRPGGPRLPAPVLPLYDASLELAAALLLAHGLDRDRFGGFREGTAAGRPL